MKKTLTRTASSPADASSHPEVSKTRTEALRRLPRYRHFFFDLDNTVTRSKSLISPDMRETMAALLAVGDVTIVSGARVAQALKQTGGLPCYYLGQNGNHARDEKSVKDIWERQLSQADKDAILRHIHSIPRTWDVADENDLVEDRGCQISYSLIGHNRPVEEKEAYDPDKKKRASLLSRYPLASDTVEVKIAGTTCFDYNEKGKNKGFNVAAFIRYMGWDEKECLYLGDALFAGGNDETMLGIIDTVPVKDPADTARLVKKAIALKKPNG